MRRQIVAFLAVVSLVTGVGLSCRAQDARTDREQLQGVWRFVSMERDGKAETPFGDLTFEGDTFTVKQGGLLVVTGTFTLDPSQTPRAIDLNVTEAERGEEIRGIYELGTDTLKWCLEEPGKDRPKEFATKGTGHYLYTLDRKK
jgi:uncharacterized protein (TIGR03067 family)